MENKKKKILKSRIGISEERETTVWKREIDKEKEKKIHVIKFSSGGGWELYE